MVITEFLKIIKLNTTILKLDFFTGPDQFLEKNENLKAKKPDFLSDLTP